MRLDDWMAPGRPIPVWNDRGIPAKLRRCIDEELPMISPDKIEDFKKEAQEEANEITLGLDNES